MQCKKIFLRKKEIGARRQQNTPHMHEFDEYYKINFNCTSTPLSPQGTALFYVTCCQVFTLVYLNLVIVRSLNLLPTRKFRIVHV